MNSTAIASVSSQSLELRGLDSVRNSPNTPKAFTESLHAAARQRELNESLPLVASSAPNTPSTSSTNQDRTRLIQSFQEVVRSWSEQHSDIDKLLSKAPKDIAPYLQAQTISQNWNLRMQLISSGMQNVQQAIRELRQAGGA